MLLSLLGVLEDGSLVVCRLTDAVRTYTEIPLDLKGDGTVAIRMQPNSFAIVEW